MVVFRQHSELRPENKQGARRLPALATPCQWGQSWCRSGRQANDYHRLPSHRSSRRLRARTKITANPATNRAAIPPTAATITHIGRSSADPEDTAGGGAVRLPPEEPIASPASGVGSCVGLTAGATVAVGLRGGGPVSGVAAESEAGTVVAAGLDAAGAGVPGGCVDSGLGRKPTRTLSAPVIGCSSLAWSVMIPENI